MIPAGAKLSFSVQGQTSTSWLLPYYTPAMLKADINTRLGRVVDVLSLSVTTQDTVITGLLPWTFHVELAIRTREAHAEARDVGAVIAHEIYQASGTMPVVTQGAYSQAGGPSPLDTLIPDVGWTTAVALVAVAVLVLAWKF